MRKNHVPAFIICCAVFAAYEFLMAASCVVDPDPQANIKADGKTQERLSSSKDLSDCSRLELVSGTINVLYETADGVKRQTCTAAGQSCAVTAGTWPSWRDMFRYQSRPGGKKMDETVTRLPGIPYGRLFSLERAATINLGKANLAQWNLTLLDAQTNKALYRQSGTQPVLQIPNQLLRPGGKYTLVIDGGTQKYKGGFDILGGTEAEDIAKQLKQANRDAGASARARKLDELIISYESNLDYEVQLLREELKL
jgi:hypothetical protein